jgi:hypothetical protein
MIVSYITYDATGRIRKTGTCAEANVELQAEPGISAKSVTVPCGDMTHYVDTGTEAVTEKGSLAAGWNKQVITADGVDEAVLSGLPEPCTVYVDGVPEEVLDGSLEFSVEDPGYYRIVVNEVMYLRQEWIIDAS